MAVGGRPLHSVAGATASQGLLGEAPAEKTGGRSVLAILNSEGVPNRSSLRQGGVYLGLPNGSRSAYHDTVAVLAPVCGYGA